MREDVIKLLSLVFNNSYFFNNCYLNYELSFHIFFKTLRFNKVNVMVSKNAAETIYNIISKYYLSIILNIQAL